MAPSKVLLVIFPGYNTLDVNGPYETLFAAGRGAHFRITVASETEITVSAEGMQIKVCFVIMGEDILKVKGRLATGTNSRHPSAMLSLTRP